MAKKSKNRKIVLLESTEPDSVIRKRLSKDKFSTVDLWVRTPDNEKLEAINVAARLCSCRSVCLAVIEDQL